MPSLGTILPTADSAVGSWLTDAGSGSNLWQKIEETIAGATDANDFVTAPNDTNNSDYKFTITATPAGFGAIKTLNWQVRYALSATPPASNKDTYGLSIRIVNGATILAAADSGGTFSVIVSTTTMSTTYANSAATAFAYVNTGASKATWDGAVCELRQTYAQTGSKDAHAVRVSAIEFTGGITGGGTILVAQAGQFVESGNNSELLRGRVISAVRGLFVLTPQDTDLRRTRVMSATRGTFILTGRPASLFTAPRPPEPPREHIERVILQGHRSRPALPHRARPKRGPIKPSW